ncbi:hypothetical protein [Leptospira sarikeiensis]|uniref:Uncharacterized protein n=1 Tax=Leptospira sarikeiensis TaxID=2484943 RepID=A0A4R9KCG2_9LEPT|nr:hypothetical protein [Leptospira sarikeiensis]TGL64612.1 hypothetical protein EHQ64_01835 [Leptospira sarikeiensis]
MKTKLLPGVPFTLGFLSIVGIYLSAPFPNDSPGCCTNQSLFSFSYEYAYCDTPDSSICNELQVDGSVEGSVNKLCPLYFPDSNTINSCPNTRVATCYVKGPDIKKIYLNTGTTPWDLSSASADCSSLGGSLQ